LTEYVTKDSGVREEFESGMVRDTNKGKPRFDLLLPQDVPYEEQLLTRIAKLMARGAEKYGDRNWEKGASQAELDRAKDSAFRHFMQWISGEDDEDHAAAVYFNLMQVERLKYKLRLADEASALAKDGATAVLNAMELGLPREKVEELAKRYGL
jgi:hypothetical protein